MSSRAQYTNAEKQFKNKKTRCKTVNESKMCKRIIFFAYFLLFFSPSTKKLIKENIHYVQFKWGLRIEVPNQSGEEKLGRNSKQEDKSNASSKVLG